jgi:hypothetical protein
MCCLGIGLHRKLVNAVAERDRQVEAFKEFNEAISLENQAAWTKMVLEWESNKTCPNPYVATKSSTCHRPIYIC